MKNEGIIQNAIFKFMEGKTIIIIAHHLETIINSDYVYAVHIYGACIRLIKIQD